MGDQRTGRSSSAGHAQHNNLQRLLDIERQAQDLTQKADQRAEAIVSEAEDKMDGMLEGARSGADKKTDAIVEGAASQAEQDSSELLDDAQSEIEDMQEHAEENLAEAVSLVISWVTAAA